MPWEPADRRIGGLFASRGRSGYPAGKVMTEYLPSFFMGMNGTKMTAGRGDRAARIGSRMSYPEAESASTAAEKRQPRQSRLVKAALACARFGQFDVTVRNVSQTGIGGQAPHALNLGERITLFLPGHDPMLGTVRWVVDRRFGIETDTEIFPDRLRAAHSDNLVTADSHADFQIVPPPKMSAWRPGLNQAQPLPGHYGRKR
jgi:hypothetical protein